MNFIKKAISSDSFKKESEEILGVFTSTVKKLGSLVEKQNTYLEDVKAQQEALRKEQESVEKNIQENKNVIDKITDFLI